MTTQDYARPDLLAETQWLEEHLTDRNLRIVDCDPPDAFNRVHIPGAVNVGTNSYIKDAENTVYVMPPGPLAEFMGALGIGDDTLVIAYDSRNSLLAARFWWVLSYYGHTNARVLNGGWRTWLAEGRPFSDKAPSIARATFTPREDPSLSITGEGLKGAIGQEGTVIWDVRSLAEHTGENTRGNRSSGHVPGAVHLEWTEVVDTAGAGAFKPTAQIRAMLEEKGITPDKQVYAY